MFKYNEKTLYNTFTSTNIIDFFNASKLTNLPNTMEYKDNSNDVNYEAFETEINNQYADSDDEEENVIDYTPCFKNLEALIRNNDNPCDEILRIYQKYPILFTLHNVIKLCQISIDKDSYDITVCQLLMEECKLTFCDIGLLQSANGTLKLYLYNWVIILFLTNITIGNSDFIEKHWHCIEYVYDNEVYFIDDEILTDYQQNLHTFQTSNLLKQVFISNQPSCLEIILNNYKNSATQMLHYFISEVGFYIERISFSDTTNKNLIKSKIKRATLNPNYEIIFQLASLLLKYSISIGFLAGVRTCLDWESRPDTMSFPLLYPPYTRITREAFQSSYIDDALKVGNFGVVRYFTSFAPNKLTFKHILYAISTGNQGLISMLLEAIQIEPTLIETTEISEKLKIIGNQYLIQTFQRICQQAFDKEIKKLL